MEKYYVALMFGGMVLIGILGLLFSLWWEKKRSAALEIASRELGFEFLGKGESQIAELTRRFEALQRGRSQRFWNVLRRSQGGKTVLIFDFKYRTGGGKNSNTHLQTVVAIQSDEIRAPQMSLSPENFMHRFASALGFQDINFDEAPEFSKMFVLRGPDEAAIREFFTVDTLNSLTRFKGMSVECNGEWMLAWQARKRVKPTEIRQLFETGFEIHLVLS